MDSTGFAALWRVADSSKYDAGEVNGRLPIGQFGIGKLAAYVLAWRLTHISKTSAGYRYTSMDFHRVTGHQYEPQRSLTVAMHEIDDAEARELLAEVEQRDPVVWQRLFGDDSAESWTAAALSDFKDLFGKLRGGTLAWVLRTGLPLAGDFAIHLNGDELESSRSQISTLLELPVGGEGDNVAAKLGF